MSDAKKRPMSKYAKKRAFLHRHALWGWQVPEPKPWKRKGAGKAGS